MNFYLCLVIAILPYASGYNSFRSLLDAKLNEVKDFAETFLREKNLAYEPSPDYPYWNFIPQYVDSLIPDGNSARWKSTCYGSNTASAVMSGDGSQVIIRLESTQPVLPEIEGDKCNDIYFAITTNAVLTSIPVEPVSSHTAADFKVQTEFTLTIPADATEAEQWDLSTKGVRIMRYVPSVTINEGTAVSNLLKTVETFLPEFTLSVPQPFAEMSIDFLSKYSHFDYYPRDDSLNQPPPAEQVHSGDAMYLMRLDGLNSMLAWAMGSTTGHVATAIWIDNELYICESTVDGAYWPTDNIQKTPYETWLQQVRDANKLAIWAPLSEEARQKYNETAAVEWFKSQEGYDYGFQTLIWSWLDTEKGNFPCLPPDFSSNCLQWELLEPLLALVDRLVPEIGDMIWNPGYIKRINGTEGERTAEMYREADALGLKSVDVISIPEQDSWLYNTTRYDEPAVGRAMVCCVFVCSTWKAAGVFGELTDSINCAEQTNWDDYVMTIHADSYQQIVGTYSLDLNNFNSKDLYAHMAETCPSFPPEYEKPSDC